MNPTKQQSTLFVAQKAPITDSCLPSMMTEASIMTEFRQPLQVQSHLEMPGILVQLGHIQRT